MPRPPKRVKSFGAVDLHFHGAFGVDLMTAKPAELDGLSATLEKRGLSGFAATTLSASEGDLASTVGRLGAWIRSGSAPGAKPLGIHLEGPFLNPESAGAHPPGILRKLRMAEIEKLWSASKETIKILTVAPETLDPETAAAISAWSKKRKVRLSIGHTRCTEEAARVAFESGFTGVTHAWNALSYHHREPGVLGAALGRKGVFVELIPDGIHVHGTFVDWTLALHPKGTFFVSDAAPAAATNGESFHRFGNLECRFQDGASRLPDGRLAGGGFLLPDSFSRWIGEESRRRGIPADRLLRDHLDRLHRIPLESIFYSKSAANRFLRASTVVWEIFRGPKAGAPGIRVVPKKKR